MMEILQERAPGKGSSLELLFEVVKEDCDPSSVESLMAEGLEGKGNQGFLGCEDQVEGQALIAGKILYHSGLVLFSKTVTDYVHQMSKLIQSVRPLGY